MTWESDDGVYCIGSSIGILGGISGLLFSIVIDLARGAGTLGATGFTGRGRLLISLGPNERGPEIDRSEVDSDAEATSCLSLDFFLSVGFSRVS